MSEEMLPVHIHDVVTPCLLVDLHKVQRNAQVMIDRCKQMGLKLRSMTKTHKCREACALATGGTKRSITVSTLAEAEFFAKDGYEDILCTVLFAQDKIPRLKRLSEQVNEFHVVVDSSHGISLLEDNPLANERHWSVFLMVDAGDAREGTVWDDEEEPLTLAKHLSSSCHIHFQGLYAHDGNSYDARGPAEIREVGDEAAERILELAARLRDNGIEVKNVGTGSTPSASHPSDRMKNLTELHPGNYIFYDSMQSCIGSCGVMDIAVRVATRVVGHYPHRNQLLVDAGFTALSCDNKDGKGIPNGSMCLIQDEPQLTYVKMSQEYGYIESRRGNLKFKKYPIGTILFLWPWHACATAACYRKYHVHEGDQVTQYWHPCSGW